MSESREVNLQVAEVLKNQETVEKMNQTSSMEEAYQVACEHMEGVSLEEFAQALTELKESDSRIELTETELDVVAGGVLAAKGAEVTVGIKYTF